MWPNSSGASADFFYKHQAADFWVAELPLTQHDARNNHWYGYIEKRNRTTLSVASQLAASIGEPLSVVGYAGMKDKFAVTRQWFSLPSAAVLQAESAASGSSTAGSPATDTATNTSTDTSTQAASGPTLAIAQDHSLQLLEQRHCGRKLRRGELLGNRFRLRLVVPEAVSQPLETALTQVSQRGFPNYFGTQRFGQQQSNLQAATRWLASRSTAKGRQRQLKPFTKGLYLSVLRAFLFNEVLAQRVRNSCWHQVIDGDLCLGVQASAPLWGRGRSQTQGAAAVLEAKALAAHQSLCEGLEHAGVAQMRRALRVRPKVFRWHWRAGVTADNTRDLHLQFELPPGCYATSLLAELGSPHRCHPPMSGHEGANG